MPIQIQIEDKTKDLQRLVDQLSDKNLTKANVRAINVAIKKAEASYKRKVLAIYNLKKSDISQFIFSNNATYADPQGTISAVKRPIGLSHFNPIHIVAGRSYKIESFGNTRTNTKTGRKEKYRDLRMKSKKAGKNSTPQGVIFSLYKGEEIRYPSAFFLPSARQNGSDKQFFGRGKYIAGKFHWRGRGTPRDPYPVGALKTLSLSAMMNRDDVQKEIKEEASTNARKEFERQVDLLLKKAGGK